MAASLRRFRSSLYLLNPTLYVNSPTFSVHSSTVVSSKLQNLQESPATYENQIFNFSNNSLRFLHLSSEINLAQSFWQNKHHSLSKCYGSRSTYGNRNPMQILGKPSSIQIPLHYSTVPSPKCSDQIPKSLQPNKSLTNVIKTVAISSVSAMPFFFLDVQEAFAVNGQFGVMEGRTVALFHPAVMGSLFLYTVWSTYLGLKCRRLRIVQTQIESLKNQVKPDSAALAKLSQLSQTMKDLEKGSFKERHHKTGAVLLGLGVLFAIGGAMNTWIRTGQLFPGPHLFAGAAMTVLWAAAAAQVPAMQRGSTLARKLHITFSTLNVLLFVTQIPTGVQIVNKVLEVTN